MNAQRARSDDVRRRRPVESWLADHYDKRQGVWLKMAKKGSGARSVNATEALEVALCFGWIDSHRKSVDESYFVQKYTPRRPRSSWSKVNTDRVEALITAGRMREPGLAQVAAAKADGRWDAAYESQRNATVPLDLKAALNKHGGETDVRLARQIQSVRADPAPAQGKDAGRTGRAGRQDRCDARSQELIGEGLKLLALSSTGSALTEYHVEAAIASIHARAPRAENTDWKTIVSLYDTLMAIRPSPIVALNRAHRDCSERGPVPRARSASAITDSDRLTAYLFYSAALGELECRRGRYEVAGKHSREALALAHIPMERRFLEQRVGDCEKACR
jgi:uncharacterized protein YdeI (YjbR/CyaY-like superfamily)